MALVGYKTRPRLHSWEAPEPPPPKSSRLLWFAVIAWFGAIYLGYLWLGTNEPAHVTEAPAQTDEPNFIENSTEPARSRIAGDASATALAVATAVPAALPSSEPTPLPPCESFLLEARGNDQERVPAHMGRSVLAQFLGDSEWTRPCRGRKRRATVKFCAAVRDGELVGLSLNSIPKSLGLENCIREQARKVPVRSETVVRIVDVTLEL